MSAMVRLISSAAMTTFSSTICSVPMFERATVFGLNGTRSAAPAPNPLDPRDQAGEHVGRPCQPSTGDRAHHHDADVVFLGVGNALFEVTAGEGCTAP